MAGSLNRVMLIGNLARDPESRRIQDNSPIVNMTVVTSDRWKDKSSGEWKEKPEFHRVVIFNEHLCKVAENYLKKGSKVYVEGSLQTRKWTDQQGVDKYTTEIVLQRFKGELTMLDGRNDNDTGGNQGSTPSGGGSDFDDEIPF